MPQPEIRQVRIIPAVALAVLVSGCMTRGKFESRLKTWEGSDVSALIESWGPPSSTYDLPDGRRMYTWSDNRGVYAAPIGHGAIAVPVGCTITFTAGKDNRVEAWRYQGNNCY